MGAADGKFAWTAKVGDKGQIVIPKEAREIFGIEPGGTVLLLGDVERGLAIVNNEQFVHLAHAVMGAQQAPDEEPKPSGAAPGAQP